MMRFGLREAVFLAVLLAMPVCAYFFVFEPQNNEISAAKKEISHKESMLDKLEAATSRSADLATANSDIADAIGVIEGRLPNSKEIDVILTKVASIARESRLELPKFSVGKPIIADRYAEQPLEMTMRGNFDDFYEFVLKLEQLDRITRVPELDLKRKSKADDGVVEASFTLSIYFQNKDEEAKG